MTAATEMLIARPVAHTIMLAVMSTFLHQLIIILYHLFKNVNMTCRRKPTQERWAILEP